MTQFEVLISRYVREDQTLLISAPSEEELQNKICMLKEVVSERFEDSWDKDFDGTPKIEIFSVEELETTEIEEEDGTITIELECADDELDIQWEELCRNPEFNSSGYVWR